MQFALDTLFNGLAPWLIHSSISWEVVQELVFVLLALICSGACLWYARASVRSTQQATSENEAYDRRLNGSVLAHDERLLAALHAELERSRTAYDRASREHWERLTAELTRGFDQVGLHIARVEEHLRLEQDQSATRLNEAMVVIQQAGLAAARLVSSRRGPNTRLGA